MRFLWRSFNCCQGFVFRGLRCARTVPTHQCPHVELCPASTVNINKIIVRLGSTLKCELLLTASFICTTLINWLWEKTIILY